MIYHDNTAQCLTLQAESPSTVNKPVSEEWVWREWQIYLLLPHRCRLYLQHLSHLRRPMENTQKVPVMALNDEQVIPWNNCSVKGQVILLRRTEINKLTLSPLGPGVPAIPLSPGMPWRPGGPGSPGVPLGPGLPWNRERTSCCLFIWEASLSLGFRICYACFEVSGVQF